MLAITGLTLSHFRSHKLAQMQLDGRPVAIHGPNGAGKTNILEAVSLLSPGRGLRRAKTVEIARRPETLGWKVTATLVSHAQRHEIETWAEDGAARQLRIDGKNAPQVALGRISRLLWLVPSMDRLWIEGAEGRRRFLDRMTLSFEPRHAEVTVEYEKAMRERNRLLKDQVSDPSWYAALEGQMATSGAAISRNRASTLDRIALAQSGAETAFPTSDLELLGPEGPSDGLDEGDLLRALYDGRPRDLQAGRTLTGPHRADLGAVFSAKGVSADQCSTGEQKALLISLILANARALAEDFGAPPIILLDEVAAHLDQDRRAALFDEVVELGAQVWMTGTGPELFEALGDRATFFGVVETDGSSKVAPG